MVNLKNLVEKLQKTSLDLYPCVSLNALEQVVYSEDANVKLIVSTDLEHPKLMPYTEYEAAMFKKDWSDDLFIITFLFNDYSDDAYPYFKVKLSTKDYHKTWVITSINC